MTDSDVDIAEKEALMAALSSHGQAFLESFDLPQPLQKKRRIEEDDGQLEEEWTGFGSRNSDAEFDDEDEGYDSTSSDGAGEDGDNGPHSDHDDEFRSDNISNTKKPAIVVFDGSGTNSSGNLQSRAQMKSFMSAKVSKISQDDSKALGGRTELSDGEILDDKSNLQNDALLHRLIHTRLLSSIHNPDLELTGAQRRKSLAGRMKELAGQTKLGKGEASVRKEERRQASRNVRLGLERKRVERQAQAVEEAKNLGNYHRSLKRIYTDDAETEETSRKRERGLRLGVGKFSNGVLKLSKDEINSVQGGFSRSAGPNKGGKRKNR